MTATSVLQCRPNSHPFPDRTLSLSEPVKIGRSVARARPSANNAIFDCKVLSRNHALLWYENGKFYLKDTKSSNGTFVNNYRLSKGSEESAPQEVCSGDIVQFGVDVMENSKKGTVTHGCIIATLKLYLPDGQEAKASSSMTAAGGMCDMSSQELFQLRSSLQEAQHRERLIESKISSFQQIVTSIQDAASQSWKAMIDEDRLLQRIELLEDQLVTFTKNASDDVTKEEIRFMISDKDRYETSTKETLQRIIGEKVEATTRCAAFERELSVMKVELEQKNETAEAAKKELEELLKRQCEQTLELKKMTENLKTAEEGLVEATNELEAKQKEWKLKLEEKEYVEEYLRVQKIQTAEHEFTKQALNSIKSKYENIKNGRLNISSSLSKSLSEFEFTEDEVKETFQMFRSALQTLHDKLWKAEEDVRKTQSTIIQLKNETELASQVEKESQNKKAQLQDELCEKRAKEESSAALMEHLRGRLEELESRCPTESPKLMEELYTDNTVTLCRNRKNTAKSEDGKESLKEVEKCGRTPDSDDEDQHSDSLSDSTLTLISEVVDRNNINGNDDISFQGKIDFDGEEMKNVEESLSSIEASYETASSEVKRIREDMGAVSVACVTASHEVANLNHQLAANEAVLLEKTRYVTTLQDIISQLESSIDLIYDHLNALTKRLSEEREEASEKKKDAEGLKEKLESAESLSEESIEKIESLRAKLNEMECNEVSSHPTSSSVDSTSKEGSTIRDTEVENLRKEVVILRNALEELRLSTKDESTMETSVLDSSTVDGDSGESACTLKKQLNSLLKEHESLKHEYLLNNSQFADLSLQNKMTIPTWFMLILVVTFALGWQRLTEWM